MRDHAYGYPVVADIGGVLVLEAPDRLTAQQAAAIKADIRRAIDRECVILAGLRLAGVVSSAGTPIYDQLIAERGRP